MLAILRLILCSGSKGRYGSCVGGSEPLRPEHLVNTVFQNPVKGILLNFGHRCADVGVLIRFWGQTVKGQGYSRRKHNGQRQPVEFHLVSKSD